MEKIARIVFIFLATAGTLSAQVTTGSGTANKIPLWTGAHSQSNSVITQVSGKIGIGTTAPVTPLTVLSPNLCSILGVSTSNYGVRGDSTDSVGVLGRHNGTTGTAAAVDGKTSSTAANAIGVLGVVAPTTPGANSAGVRGANGGTGGNGIGVYGTQNGSGYGVYGQTPSGYGVYGSGGSGVYGVSPTSGGNGVVGTANTGSSAYGVWARTSSGYGVVASSSSTSGYAGYFTGDTYRAGYFKSFNSGIYSLYVDTANGPSQPTSGLEVNGSARFEGNIYAAGSKAGYVVDEMQNVDTVALEPGDVVVIAADSGAPVLGEIPTPRIKLATVAYDTGVVGVVDQIMYVPNEATRRAYQAQLNADREVAAQSAARSNSSIESENKLPLAADIPDRITDEAGTLHADVAAASAAPGQYCSVVTLGSYKIVKVDANYGAIRAGDLLTTSPHAGYAMRVSDKIAASGAIIGKSLSSLSSGLGTVSILITLK